MFAILQKYDFSSKSQRKFGQRPAHLGCLRYCKSTIFQANHNQSHLAVLMYLLFAILQKYDFSSKSQHLTKDYIKLCVVCDTAKVRFFKQITTWTLLYIYGYGLFAILQKYDFSSKSQLQFGSCTISPSCLRYCKSTIFQANHNGKLPISHYSGVVCDTAKVRFFKQITTWNKASAFTLKLFAILQKYDFSSKSQLGNKPIISFLVVCDTAKVRFFKQITTLNQSQTRLNSCLRYCKSTIFQANHNLVYAKKTSKMLFAILQKYDFSSKSQQRLTYHF